MNIRMEHHQLVRDAADWDEAVARHVGSDAQLIAVSQWIPDARVYSRQGRIYKVRRTGSGKQPWMGDLSMEAAVMQQLGREVRLARHAEWEILETAEIQGVPLSALRERIGFRRKVRLIRKIARATSRLNDAGVAHGDLRLDNVLVGPRDEVTIIDFDQARFQGTARAMWMDWIGFGGTRTPNPIWKTVADLLLPKALTLARRLGSLIRPPLRDRTTDTGPPELVRAWKVAAASRANAAGQGLAYYAFTYQGQQFYGERPWYLRWDAIRKHIDFAGKSVVELGCNLGLLSSFALVYGAASARGVDADGDIIEAARNVASAFGVRPDFVCADLDGEDPWEESVGRGDIVVAMSLLNWVRDKDRLLSYLRGFPTVLYEGHEDTGTEAARLRAIGFDDVAEICRTERGRSVLIARRKTEPLPEAW